MRHDKRARREIFPGKTLFYANCVAALAINLSVAENGVTLNQNRKFAPFRKAFVTHLEKLGEMAANFPCFFKLSFFAGSFSAKFFRFGAQNF
ncbi:MAG TPA: hypothetical protein VIM69_00195 [Opitutaceae bacterium]